MIPTSKGKTCETCNFLKEQHCLFRPKPYDLLAEGLDPTTHFCGQWETFVWWDEENCKPYVKPDIVEANPWLLEIPAYTFYPPFEYKNHWPYVAHIVEWFHNLKIYKLRASILKCSGFWFANRNPAGKPFKPRLQDRKLLGSRFSWMVDNMEEIFIMPDHAIEGLRSAEREGLLRRDPTNTEG